jgi:hypothetical protein
VDRSSEGEDEKKSLKPAGRDKKGGYGYHQDRREKTGRELQLVGPVNDVLATLERSLFCLLYSISFGQDYFSG